MSVLIVGAHGSMGRRYQAIMRYLGREYRCVDKDDTDEHVAEVAKVSSGIILATPTDTHLSMIRRFLPLRRPILCEKPVTKSIDELREVLAEIASAKVPFRMMFQYQMLNDAGRIGDSHYNYFKHGNDGLIWDCLQVIALGRRRVQIRGDSPIWSCKLNGRTLRLDHMDAAYIAYVQKWFNEPKQDTIEILRAHEKTRQMELEGIHG